MTTDPAVRPHAHFGDDYSPDRCAWTGLDGSKCDVPLRQSATTTDPTVQAAAEAIHRARCCDIDHPGPHAFYLDHAEAAVAAARPIIEAEVRERIAAEIEAQLRDWLSLGSTRGDGPLSLGSAEWAVQRAYESCAVIARGQS